MSDFINPNEKLQENKTVKCIFVVIDKKTQLDAMNYLFGKVSKQEFEKALNDTIELDKGKHTNEIVYETVMNSILNVLISYCSPKMLKSVKNMFSNHYKN